MAQAPGREANSLRLARPVNSWRQMADGVGFEPTRPLRVYGISSAAPSTELGDPSAHNSANNARSPSWVDARFAGHFRAMRALDRETRPRSILPTTMSRLARATRASPTLLCQARARPCDPSAVHSANNGESPSATPLRYFLLGGALPEDVPKAFAPSGPPTITVSVMSRNNPCSMTPVSF